MINIKLYRNNGQEIEVLDFTTDKIWFDGNYQYINDTVKQETYVCPVSEFEGIEFDLSAATSAPAEADHLP